MNLKDNSLGPGRKILLAQEHGFLPEESNLVDFSLFEASRMIKNAAIVLRKCESVDSVEENKAKAQEFLSKSLDFLKELDSSNSVSFYEEEPTGGNLDGDRWRSSREFAQPW